MARKKTYILPGLGVDARMYSHPAYARLPDTVFVDWPVFDNEKTLARVAGRITAQYAIEPGSVVGGSSLGGMVACEIAGKIPVAKVILIGSATTPDLVNPLLKALSVFSPIVPVQFLQRLLGRTPWPEHSNIIKMMTEADPGLIKNMSRAIFKWQGNPAPTAEICAIHGVHDKVIFPPPRLDVHLIDGRHVIAMSNPEEVAAFIGACLD